MVFTMIKLSPLFFIFSLFSHLWGFDQLIVVIAPEMNSTVGSLQRYEKSDSWKKTGDAIEVTLGRSGLGHAIGTEPLKREGDGRSPVGLFSIDASFGYAEVPNSKLPYYHATKELICVDEVSDARYNKMALYELNNSAKSFEWMRREDGVYTHGAIINYNPKGEKGRGSCIFFHLNAVNKKPTSGCTALDETPLLELLGWFDPLKKPHLLQIPLSECGKYQKEFVGIECK